MSHLTVPEVLQVIVSTASSTVLDLHSCGVYAHFRLVWAIKDKSQHK